MNSSYASPDTWVKNKCVISCAANEKKVRGKVDPEMVSPFGISQPDDLGLHEFHRFVNRRKMNKVLQGDREDINVYNLCWGRGRDVMKGSVSKMPPLAL